MRRRQEQQRGCSSGGGASGCSSKRSAAMVLQQQHSCSCSSDAVLTTRSSSQQPTPRHLRSKQQRLISRSCWMPLLLLVMLAGGAGAAAAASPPAPACPFSYPRHSLAQVRSKAVRPYLFGGVYNKGRPCPNCDRGGLWSNFCGFSRLEKVKYWHLQVCNASTIDSIIQETLKQGNAKDVLTLTPCDLWHFMRGRTTWVIGDSMSKDLFRALRCFMVEFTDLRTYHATTNYSAMHQLQNIPGYGEPHCVHMPDRSRICQIHAIEGDLFIATNRTSFGGVVPMVQRHLGLPDDIYITSFGLWHGETRQDAYQKYLHQLGQYFKQHRARYPHMFFMETPKQHFDSEDGDYKVPWLKTRKGPWKCQAIKGVSLRPDGSVAAQPGNAVADFVARGSWRNIYAREILRGKYGMPLVSIYNVTVPAWRFHRANLEGQECSHFCHPSLPQLWVHALWAALRGARLPPVADPSKQKLSAGCAAVWDREEKHFGNPVPAERVISDAEQQKGFWDWLFGRTTYVLRDGVLVPAAAAGADGGRQRHGATLTPWAGLQQLLEHAQARGQLTSGGGGQTTAVAAAATTQQQRRQQDERG